MTACIQTRGHLYLQALLRVVWAAAAHAVVVGEVWVAAIKAPAVATTLDRLCVHLPTQTLTTQIVLLHALFSIIQAAVQVYGTGGITVANTTPNLEWLVGTTPLFAANMHYRAFDAYVVL